MEPNHLRHTKDHVVEFVGLGPNLNFIQSPDLKISFSTFNGPRLLQACQHNTIPPQQRRLSVSFGTSGNHYLLEGKAQEYETLQALESPCSFKVFELQIGEGLHTKVFCTVMLPEENISQETVHELQVAFSHCLEKTIAELPKTIATGISSTSISIITGEVKEFGEKLGFAVRTALEQINNGVALFYFATKSQPSLHLPLPSNVLNNTIDWSQLSVYTMKYSRHYVPTDGYALLWRKADILDGYADTGYRLDEDSNKYPGLLTEHGNFAMILPDNSDPIRALQYQYSSSLFSNMHSAENIGTLQRFTKPVYPNYLAGWDLDEDGTKKAFHYDKETITGIWDTEPDIRVVFAVLVLNTDPKNNPNDSLYTKFQQNADIARASQVLVLHMENVRTEIDSILRAALKTLTTLVALKDTTTDSILSIEQLELATACSALIGYIIAGYIVEESQDSLHYNWRELYEYGLDLDSLPGPSPAPKLTCATLRNLVQNDGSMRIESRRKRAVYVIPYFGFDYADSIIFSKFLSQLRYPFRDGDPMFYMLLNRIWGIIEDYLIRDLGEVESFEQAMHQTMHDLYEHQEESFHNCKGITASRDFLDHLLCSQESNFKKLWQFIKNVTDVEIALRLYQAISVYLENYMFENATMFVHFIGDGKFYYVYPFNRTSTHSLANMPAVKRKKLQKQLDMALLVTYGRPDYWNFQKILSLQANQDGTPDSFVFGDKLLSIF